MGIIDVQCRRQNLLNFSPLTGPAQAWQPSSPALTSQFWRPDQSGGLTGATLLSDVSPLSPVVWWSSMVGQNNGNNEIIK